MNQKTWLKSNSLSSTHREVGSRWSRYLVAILTTAVVLGLKFWLISTIKWPEGSLVLSTGGILISAWFGGFGPGILSTFLNYLVADLLFIGPHSLILQNSLSENIRILIFVLEGVLISYLSELLHRSVWRAEVYAEKISQSEQLLSSLVNNVADYAIFMINIQGKIATWNTGAALVTGYSAAEVIGRHFLFILSINTKTDINKPFALAQSKGRYESEKWRYKKDGTKYWGNIMIFPILDMQNQISGYATIMRDLTERKLLEDKKAEFLSIVAHELNTPLATVKVITETLIRDWYKRHIKNIKITRIEDINNELARLSRLVSDLLDISRIESKKLVLHKRETDLRRLITEAIRKIEIIYAGRNIDFKGERVPRILIDSDQIEQVLINLIINAVQYSPSSSQIIVRLRVRKGEVIVSVADQGKGIQRKNLTTVFNKYIQENKNDQRGFGLGLYISKQIIVKHKGKIWVDSIEGRGSVFSFSLPAM